MKFSRYKAEICYCLDGSDEMISLAGRSPPLLHVDIIVVDTFHAFLDDSCDLHERDLMCEHVNIDC